MYSVGNKEAVIHFLVRGHYSRGRSEIIGFPGKGWAHLKGKLITVPAVKTFLKA